jgi:hypothetical protein
MKKEMPSLHPHASTAIFFIVLESLRLFENALQYEIKKQ